MGSVEDWDINILLLVSIWTQTQTLNGSNLIIIIYRTQHSHYLHLIYFILFSLFTDLMTVGIQKAAFK